MYEGQRRSATICKHLVENIWQTCERKELAVGCFTITKCSAQLCLDCRFELYHTLNELSTLYRARGSLDVTEELIHSLDLATLVALPEDECVSLIRTLQDITVMKVFIA